MEIEVLGRPGIRIAGARTDLKGRQPALLAALVLAAPRPVRADQLIEVVWGTTEPADPANALQQRVSSLRRAVDPERSGQVLVTVPGGYALHVGDDVIDARRFERGIIRAREALAADHLEVARGHLDAALALWQGDAFAGIADEAWLRPEVERLEQLRLDAIEDRFEVMLGLGGGSELITGLNELVAAEPLRERSRGQLMRALYRAGRQADALAEYERVRELLAEELGVDPSPELRRIHLQILEQADDLEVAVLSRPRSSPLATNLPEATRPVIGREDDLDRIGQALGSHRLVTLTGPGGVGKTTLAVESARRWPRPADGTWLVELAAVTEDGGVVEAIAAALGIEGTGPGGRVDHTRLVRALADRELLLVLDNGEHVVEELAEVVTTLLAGVAGLRVIVTSREILALDGEQVWPVPPMAVPAAGEDLSAIVAAPAIELLVAGIRAHDPSFVLDDAADAELAATIVRRLDGVPLAIELAAARHRVLRLPDLAASLEDRFAVLSDTRRGRTSRQRTLRGAIEWSWTLLEPDQQRAWAALAVPLPGADLELASALLSAAEVEGHPLDALRDLVDRSILTVDPGPSTRYRMLESLRMYGQEQLRSLGLDEAVRRRHAAAVEARLDQLAGGQDPRRFDADLDGMRALLEEVRSVLRWSEARGDRSTVQRVAGRLGWSWLLGGLAAEGSRWLDAGLEAMEGLPPDHLDVEATDPDALLWASGLRTSAGDPAGLAWAELAQRAATRPDRKVLADLFAAVHLAHGGRIEEALRAFDTVVEEATSVGGWVAGYAHLVTAQIGRLAGLLEGVREHAEAALGLLDEPTWARAQVIDILIDAIDPETDPVRSRRLAIEGLELCQRSGFPELEGRMLLQLGVATHAAGEHALAARYLEDAVTLTAEVGAGPSLGFALLVAGAHARRRGERDGALEQLTQARQLLGGTAMAYGRARAALELAEAYLDADDVVAAATVLEEGERFGEQVQDPEVLADLTALRRRLEEARTRA